MARLEEPEDDLSQEDETKTRRAFHNHRSSWSSDILTKTTELMANPRRLPCSITQTLQRERHLWQKLP